MSGFGKAIAVSVVSSVCGGAAWLAVEPEARQFVGLAPPSAEQVTQVSTTAPAAPPATPSFDCAHAASAIERLICADAWLAESDQLLSASWTRLRGEGLAEGEVVAQRAWIERRNACVLEEEAQACVRTAYRERIHALEALREKATAGAAAASAALPSSAP